MAKFVTRSCLLAFGLLTATAGQATTTAEKLGADPVPNAVLAEVRGGRAVSLSLLDVREIERTQAFSDMLLFGQSAQLAMDNWWADVGRELIVNSGLYR